VKTIDELFQRAEPLVGIRAMHIDCKGVPPTPQRLLGLLATAAALRYNAVVIEWEDMFPWTVDTRFRCETAYPPEDVRAIGRRAAELGIEVIPLVQCLGHMEFVLKHNDYAHLREVPDCVSCLHPLADGARDLIRSLVADVLALLPDVRHVHLGGDEAWTLGTVPATAAYVDKHGKGGLYLQHVGPILDELAGQGKRPMLWHDMMVGWDDRAMTEMAAKADLVVWGYAGHPKDMSKAVNAEVFRRFGEIGVTMWGATAYKGADGCSVDLPVFETRRDNALAWAEVAPEVGLKGIITTAWSRYMHLETQCEPIDGALDSLAAHGVILHDGQMPPDGREACVAALDAIGEGPRFRACYEALRELTDYRRAGWAMVQQLREEAVVIERDPWRHAAAWQSLGNLRRHVGQGEDLARKVHAALAGLVDALWVQRYLDTRIEPFRTEANELARVLPALDRGA